jgi:hypothetical protein
MEVEIVRFGTNKELYWQELGNNTLNCKLCSLAIILADSSYTWKTDDVILSNS